MEPIVRAGLIYFHLPTADLTARLARPAAFALDNFLTRLYYITGQMGRHETREPH
jgi:hypothetical protein